MELKIRQLSKRYANGVQALDNISLDIPPGMFGLLGPNGAGKSTLMRILATLQEPDAGSISFGDIDLLKDKDSIRCCLGYLPQEFGLYPDVRADEMLDHFARLKGCGGARSRREIVGALLRKTNLFEARNRRLGTFSGGMKQRFGIAQALLGDPKLIIVDEPTAGLDPEERVRFHNLLSEIGEHIVVILSTHIVDDVADLCPRMAVIREGRVVQTGEPSELVARLRDRIWKRFIDKNELHSYEADFRVLSTRRLAGKTLVRLYSEQRPNAGFESVAPDLEDVYFVALKDRGVPA